MATFVLGNNGKAAMEMPFRWIWIFAACAGLVLWSVDGTDCLDADVAVFPYESLCTEPAVYSTPLVSESYGISVSGPLGGSLSPEWDATTSTFYVRLSSSPAYYQLSPASPTPVSYVSLADSVVIVNVASGKALGWSQVDGEQLLVEVDRPSAATFQFVLDEKTPLPCSLTSYSECHSYELLTDSENGTGLTESVKEGVTYLKPSTSKLLSFTLSRSSSSRALEI
ncbi:hypothetical protein KP509_01G065500 [Ceratopteris richardii]|uniref:Uncharacterized protein n=1 Tax=Ceratopteris richardii TaxID=49495 RepID=A0A8T2VH17_CERRI|nr:hypothetical protein KP509_01G065500 [Ceratopteris richardii]